MQEPGQVKRLSVAVAVDGVTTLGPKGKLNYAPRSDDEMNRIKELVRSAVGYSAQRGDQISVINVRFDHGDEEGTNSALPAVLNFDKNDMMRVAELAVLLVMAAMVVFRRRRHAVHAPAGRRHRRFCEPAALGAPDHPDVDPATRRCAGRAHRHRQDRRPGEGLVGEAGVRIRRNPPGGIGLDPPGLAA